MTQLPSEMYALVRKVFETLELSDEEKSKYEDKFEKMMLAKFAEAIMKKMPPNEAERLKNLANNSGEGLNQTEIEKQLQQWFTGEEMGQLFQKISDQLFEEFLRVAYSSATTDQKQKLEQLFPEEVLN